MIITKELKKKIDYLHSRVGAFEWSGELITREKGTIIDLDDWEITAEDMFLVDIGTAGGTEYEVNKGAFKSSDIIELYEKYPELEEGILKLQHIHTHHNMGCFFSGTDWENLEDRALVSNYFLMLIVNFAGVAIAKVAFKARVEGNRGTELHFSNNGDSYESLKLGGEKEKEVLVVMDCKVEIENTIEVDEEFVQRYEIVAKAIADDKTTKEEERKKKYNGGYGGYGREVIGTQRELPFKGAVEQWTSNEYWDSALPENTYNPKSIYKDDYELNPKTQMWEKKSKKISEMTEKEYERWEMDQEAERVFLQDQASQGAVFQEKDARAFLNSIIDSSYMMENYKDLQAYLLAENGKLKTIEETERWVDDWQDMLPEHFDVIFQNGSIEQYGYLMDACVSYLDQYKHIRLVRGMLEALKDEIEMSYSPVKTY